MPRIADDAPNGGFWKGFLTALLQLGAVIGAFNQGWIAERISRKYSITVAACIFIIGSVMQTAAFDYALLVVGRLIAGIGVGMLSMVVPMYIAEVSPPEIRGSLLVRVLMIWSKLLLSLLTQVDDIHNTSVQ